MRAFAILLLIAVSATPLASAGGVVQCVVWTCAYALSGGEGDCYRGNAWNYAGGHTYVVVASARAYVATNCYGSEGWSWRGVDVYFHADGAMPAQVDLYWYEYQSGPDEYCYAILRVYGPYHDIRSIDPLCEDVDGPPALPHLPLP